MYLLVLQGGLAGGAALWGEIAEKVGMERSLLYAALGLLMGILAAAGSSFVRQKCGNTVGMD